MWSDSTLDLDLRLAEEAFLRVAGACTDVIGAYNRRTGHRAVVGRSRETRMTHSIEMPQLVSIFFGALLLWAFVRRDRGSL